MENKCKICKRDFPIEVYKTYSYVVGGVTHKKTEVCRECKRKYFGA